MLRIVFLFCLLGSRVLGQDIDSEPLEQNALCRVVETYPEGQIPVDGAKGVRKTWLEGYSPVRDFYSPDYSALPPEPDYRRTPNGMTGVYRNK